MEGSIYPQEGWPPRRSVAQKKAFRVVWGNNKESFRRTIAKGVSTTKGASLAIKGRFSGRGEKRSEAGEERKVAAAGRGGENSASRDCGRKKSGACGLRKRERGGE